MSNFIPQYQELTVHRMMLRDHVRMEAYRSAINESVKDGDVVIDYGAGTGVLSIYAAKAGAKKVYAIECTPIIHTAQRLAEANGVADRIVFLHGDASDVEIPEKADVIVSEWMGGFALQENMLPDLLKLRDRTLKQGGLMLPSNIDLYMAPLDSDDLDDTWGYFSEDTNGINMLPISDFSVHELYTAQITEDDQAASAVHAASIDLLTLSSAEMVLDLEFPMDREALINGLGGWFVARFPGGTVLPTGPLDPQTHWQQTVFPVYPGVQLEDGDRLTLRLSALPNGKTVRFIWEMSIPGTDWQQRHDTHLDSDPAGNG